MVIENAVPGRVQVGTLPGLFRSSASKIFRLPGMKPLSDSAPKFCVGQTVTVRPGSPTLSDFEAGLYTEQMRACCGQSFKVAKVVNSLFSEKEKRSLKPISPLYILENCVCNGLLEQFSPGCDRGCFLLWPEDRLELASLRSSSGLDSEAQAALDLATAQNQCQSQVILQIGQNYRWPVNLYQRLVRKYRYFKRRFARGLSASCYKWPSNAGHRPRLEPGQIVRVRSISEIKATLDESRKTQGCTFQAEMFAACEKTFKILKKVDAFYDEASQRVCKSKNLYLLEGSFCSGQCTYLSQCDRSCHLFWHVDWLESPKRGI